MERHRQAVEKLVGQRVDIRGPADLAIQERKFSGNAQRRRRHALLFHGALLCGLDLSGMGRFLRFPSQSPAYRAGRSHEAFLLNLPVSAAAVKDTLRQAWQADEIQRALPWAALERLAAEKYSRPSWNFRF
jgi:lipoate-protein ligase A